MPAGRCWAVLSRRVPIPTVVPRPRASRRPVPVRRPNGFLISGETPSAIAPAAPADRPAPARAVLLLLALVTTGCGTVHFDVPEGARVKLLEIDAPASVRVERTCWYALWGAKPLGDNHTASMIAENHLAEVRLHNQYSASDVIINTFTSIVSFSRRRIIVEGNTAAGATQ